MSFIACHGLAAFRLHQALFRRITACSALGFYSPMYEDYQNNYLELPIMAQFRFGGHLKMNKVSMVFSISGGSVDTG